MKIDSRVGALAACALLWTSFAGVQACGSGKDDDPDSPDAAAPGGGDDSGAARSTPDAQVDAGSSPDGAVASDGGAGGGSDAALTVTTADIAIYGGTPSGIAAAVVAGRLGKSVVIVEASPWIGGMMAGGLSATDIGTASSVGGFAAEFLAATHAAEVDAGVAVGTSPYAFEPHVARQVFTSLLAAAEVTVVTSAPLASVNKTGTTLASFTTTNGREFQASEFIDASYEGDLMVMAGVDSTYGRESSAQYNEPSAGVQVPRQLLEHDLPDGGVIDYPIDPYLQPGDPDSGLIFEVSPGPAAAPGSADKSVQAYNYRLCATDVATHGSNVVSFAAKVPANYDEARYEGVARYIQALLLLHPGEAGGSPEAGALIGGHFLDVKSYLPNGKLDINGGSPFSTDVVLIPNGYPEGDAGTRAQIAGTIEDYIRGLFYFLQTSDRVPAAVNSYVAQYGLCKDEFTDNDNWPTELYIREGRRMIGSYVMTELNVVGDLTVSDPIGLANYNMDSHIVQLLAIDGAVYQEGYMAGAYAMYDATPGTPYGISYRALTPKAAQAKNLLVSVTLSASRMADRSLRVEPTYMIMGQAAGTAASLAIDGRTSVQAVDYPTLAAQLVKDEQLLTVAAKSK